MAVIGGKQVSWKQRVTTKGNFMLVKQQKATSLMILRIITYTIT